MMESSLRHKYGNYLFILLLLVFTIDPANVIFRVKDIVFILFVGYNIVCFRPDYSKLPYILLVLCAITVSLIFGEAQMTNMKPAEVFAAYKAIAPMILLLWIREYDVVKLSRMPIVAASILAIVLFWLVTLVPAAEGFVYYFVTADDTIIISRRSFLGLDMFCLHYRTIVSFMFVFALYINNFFQKEYRKVSTIICMLLVLHAYLISGTRSTMLLPFFLFGIIGFYHLRSVRYFKYIMYPLIAMSAVAFLAVLVMLMMEKGEASNLVKYAHLTSYWDLFCDHPEYVLFGQGPGALFYTDGFKMVTAKTEWTYLELIRNYGLFCLPILYVFYRPLLFLRKNWNVSFTYSLFWTYLAYLLIAGTNPLLLTSIGMTSLLTVYSYEEKLKREEAYEAK